MNIFIRFIIYGKDPGPIRELVDFNQLTVGPEKKEMGIYLETSRLHTLKVVIQVELIFSINNWCHWFP